ncbi:ngoBIR [Acrasis kona]|uniref:NgoBIR n=1 Tax=Acrasis kona TaxID=1008807 RepID=A0AAW2YJ39_9EUKA
MREPKDKVFSRDMAPGASQEMMMHFSEDLKLKHNIHRNSLIMNNQDILEWVHDGVMKQSQVHRHKIVFHKNLFYTLYVKNRHQSHRLRATVKILPKGASHKAKNEYLFHEKTKIEPNGVYTLTRNVPLNRPVDVYVKLQYNNVILQMSSEYTIEVFVNDYVH